MSSDLKSANRLRLSFASKQHNLEVPDLLKSQKAKLR